MDEQIRRLMFPGPPGKHLSQAVGVGAECTRCDVWLSYATARDTRYLNQEGVCYWNRK